MTSILNLNQIKQYLPHRYPFLFVDAVTALTRGEYCQAKKAVTCNETVFNGHFPENPVLPGVIQIEAMCQTAALLAILSGAKVDGKQSVYFTGVTDCKFTKPVVPGDVLVMEATVVKKKMGVWRFDTRCEVDGELASVAKLSAMAAPTASPSDLPEGFPAPIFEVS